MENDTGIDLRLEVLLLKYPDVIEEATKRWLKTSVLGLVFKMQSGCYTAIDNWLVSQIPEMAGEEFSNGESYLYRVWKRHEIVTHDKFKTYEKMMERWQFRYTDRVGVDGV